MPSHERWVAVGTSQARRQTAFVAATVLALAATLAPAAVGAASPLTALYVDGGYLAPSRAVYVVEADTCVGRVLRQREGPRPHRGQHGQRPEPELPSRVRRPVRTAARGRFVSERDPISLQRRRPAGVRHRAFGRGLQRGVGRVHGQRHRRIRDHAHVVRRLLRRRPATTSRISRGELRYASDVGLKALVPYVGTLDVGPGVTGRATAVKTLTLAARGTQSTTVGNLTLGGSDAGDYQVISNRCSGATLAPGATCVVTVKMTATAIGDRAGASDPVGRHLPGNAWCRARRQRAAVRTVGISRRLRIVGAGSASDRGPSLSPTDSTAATANVSVYGGQPTYRIVIAGRVRQRTGSWVVQVTVEFRPDAVGSLPGYLQWSIQGNEALRGPTDHPRWHRRRRPPRSPGVPIAPPAETRRGPMARASAARSAVPRPTCTPSRRPTTSAST